MKRGATKEEIIRITQELITRNGIRAVRADAGNLEAHPL